MSGATQWAVSEDEDCRECVDCVSAHLFREMELGQANTGHRPLERRAQTSNRQLTTSVKQLDLTKSTKYGA